MPKYLVTLLKEKAEGFYTDAARVCIVQPTSYPGLLNYSYYVIYLQDEDLAYLKLKYEFVLIEKV